MLKQQPQAMTSSADRASVPRQQGFTLIEILVTLFILAIGLLGLAGLLFEGMSNNQGAYLRTQASILAYDMADRMRANSAQAANYAGASGFSTEDSNTLPACASADTGCTPSDQVTVDLVEWTQQIQSVGTGIPMVPGGAGSIDYDAAPNVYTIEVQWRERSRGGDAGEQIAGDSSYSVSFTL